MNTKTGWYQHTQNVGFGKLRATSHMRLRAYDHYTSSTLIGWTNGADPSSLHTTLEGPMEYEFLHGIKWIVFHGHLDYFQTPPLGGRLNTKTQRPWDCEILHRLIYYGLSCVRTLHEQEFIEVALSWGPVNTLHEFGSVLGQPLETYFGHSQFHGHGSWLECEVVLMAALHGSRPIGTLTCVNDTIHYKINFKTFTWWSEGIIIIDTLMRQN
jgi:hypothetical protein